MSRKRSPLLLSAGLFLLIATVLIAGKAHSQYEEQTEWEGHVRSGRAATESGDFEQAERALLKALKIARDFSLGDPRLGFTLFDLGRVHFALGRYQKADAAFQQAIEILQEWGKSHPVDFANATGFLVGLYETTGDLDSAERYAQKAIRILEEVRTTEPSWKAAMAAALNRAGVVAWRKGRTSEAIRLYEQGLQLSGGNESVNIEPRTSITANLAYLYTDTGQFAEADFYYQQAFKLLKGLDPVPIPTFFALASNFAEFLINQGKCGEAESILSRLMDEAPGKLGAAHSYYGVILTNMGALRRRQGDIGAAKDFFNK
ncbi:MAG: tetratricopeptide repeat protein, partial [Bdellovibrionota bacterium]